VAATNDIDPLDGDNWVPGTPTDQSAYRSELAGIAGILSVVAITIQHYDITKGSITVALDGYSAQDQSATKTPLRIDQPGIREAVRDQNNHLGWNNFVLGRWSPKWQKVQQQFYTQTNSKQTSKRWATAIIHKLLLTVWDQWQSRNKIAHSDEGPIAQHLHRTLNNRILEEFQEDNTQLPVGDKYLFRAYTYLTLQAMPREDKQRWLESVDLARKVKNYDNAPTPHLAVMRNFMQHWLN
jgi:hypothetical protein